MNVQPENNFMPVTTHTANFNSTSSYAGHYNIVGGNLSITVTTGSTPTDLTPGMEWDFSKHHLELVLLLQKVLGWK